MIKFILVKLQKWFSQKQWEIFSQYRLIDMNDKQDEYKAASPLRPNIRIQYTVTHAFSFSAVYFHLQFSSTAYTQNLYLSHNFWNLTLKHQNHTPNLQNNTLTLSIFYFLQNTTHNYLCNTKITGINIMAKVFANVCFWDVFVIFWMQCFILQEMWGILHFVCAIYFVCKVLKKKFWPLWLPTRVLPPSTKSCFAKGSNTYLTH